MLTLDIRQQLGAFTLNTCFAAPAGQITVLFGRSGAGKTSLINAISGLSRPDQGHITLADRTLFCATRALCLPPEARRIGYVFQDARLFPHYRVAGNLNYGRPATVTEAVFTHIVELLDIGHLLDRYPKDLSGGEKQRVAIGRALLSAPQLLLMDEPLASLDLPRKQELLPYLERLAKETDIPIVYVTHSLDEVLHLADRIVLLEAGNVIANGPTAEVWNSAAMRPWLGEQAHSTLLDAQFVAHHPDYPLSKLQVCADQFLWVSQVAATPQQSIRIRIFASDISLAQERPVKSSIRNILPVQVVRIARTATQVEVLLGLGHCQLWAHITPWAADELALAVGMTLYAQLKSVSVTQEDWRAQPLPLA